MAFRETDSAYRRRKDGEDMVRQLDAMFRPAAEANARAERERFAREVAADQFGYVWWHHWERRK